MKNHISPLTRHYLTISYISSDPNIWSQYQTITTYTSDGGNAADIAVFVTIRYFVENMGTVYPKYFPNGDPFSIKNNEHDFRRILYINLNKPESLPDIAIKMTEIYQSIILSNIEKEIEQRFQYLTERFKIYAKEHIKIIAKQLLKLSVI
jgi:hypothetical protein